MCRAFMTRSIWSLQRGVVERRELCQWYPLGVCGEGLGGTGIGPLGKVSLLTSELLRQVGRWQWQTVLRDTKIPALPEGRFPDLAFTSVASCLDS